MKAIIIAALLCEHCGRQLMRVNDDGLGRDVIVCKNPKCGSYNVRYEVPTIMLKKAKGNEGTHSSN